MPGVTMRVVLSEANPALREGLRRSFECTSDLSIVAETSDETTLMRALQTIRPEALLIEAGMPTARMLECIRRALLLLPALRLVVTFSENQADDVPAFLAAGVQACLARDAAPSEFLHALRAIAEGGIYLSHSLAETVFLARRGNLAPAPYGLTEREAEVLNFIGCGFSNKEIARRLALSVRTVETHRLNIRRKTGAARLRDLVRAARELGLEPVPAEAMASPPPALRHLRSV